MSISLWLGYPDDSLEPTLDPTRQARVDIILLQLTAIDTALQQGSLDSMAVKVGDLGVDYTSHLAALKIEGSRQLEELSQVSGLALKYDKYSRKRYDQSIGLPANPLNVISYF